MSLYSFQREDVNTLVGRRRSMLCHQMGLGKTRIAAKCIEEWKAKAVVFCKKNDMLTWEEEILAATKLVPLVYTGNPKARVLLQEAWKSGQFQVLITHYSFLDEVREVFGSVWPTVVADEYHLYGLINRKSVTFKSFKEIRSLNMLLLTGTPIRRDPSDLWGPIHLIDRKNYTSFWKFVDTHCVVQEDWLGHKKIMPYAKNPTTLRYLLYERLMIRRTKDEIKDQLPSDKLRAIKFVEPTDEQRRLYRELDRNMIAQLEQVEDIDQLNYILAKTAPEKVLRLRQLLVSPRVLGARSLGASIEYLIDALSDLARETPAGPTGYDNAAAFIATPFRLGVEVIEEALAKALPHFARYVVMGGMKDGEAHETVKKFQSHIGNRVLISTIRSATGYTATAAKVGFFVGAEWSAVDNVQAEDRIHRIGQTEDVVLTYIVNRNTVEGRVLRVVGDKMLAEKSALGK